MTIHEIKRRTAETSPYFFNRGTLKFFGQTLKSFTVVKYGNKYLISAPFGHGKPSGKTERLFNPDTNKLERLPY